jgi:multicomponent Na+:H+ antiporter subunit D
MWFTAAVFLLGAWGLSGAPPFGTLLGESMISDSAKEFHHAWLAYVFIFAEALTAAAVFRVVFRIFFGWGEPAPEDEPSQTEEHPETEERHGGIPGVLFVPAAALVLLGIAISAVPNLRSVSEAAGNLFIDQSGYEHAVLDNSQPIRPAEAPSEPMTSSIVRGSIAGALALILAILTVVGKKFAAPFRAMRALERGNPILRLIHSGHPGDYVAWLSFGTALLGAMFVWLLR